MTVPSSFNVNVVITIDSTVPSEEASDILQVPAI